MLCIVLVILRYLGLRKANVMYCSSDFKVLGLEKSKCSFLRSPVITIFALFYLPYEKSAGGCTVLHSRLFCNTEGSISWLHKC
jgi:hypothetical protein